MSNSIITNGLSAGAKAVSNLILAPFSLFISITSVKPPEPPKPESFIGGGGVSSPRYSETDDGEDAEYISTIKFEVKFKNSTKRKRINIKVEEMNRSIAIMKNLKNFSWEPKTVKSLKQWK